MRSRMANLETLLHKYSRWRLMDMTFSDPRPDSPAWHSQRLLHIAAQGTIPVLITGETGCGKEMAARYLHQKSPRHQAPFVAVNCGGINPTLLESTLFGSVKGAYTGSQENTPGLIRCAQGGSLFLDELGEMTLEAQTRLLRVLQERKVTPVGGTEEIPVDFRLICATHQNLPLLIQQKKFRMDLYYRVACFPIRLPPLRDRQADLFYLATYLWQEIQPNQPDLIPLLTQADRKAMEQHFWPGNIRQLRNVLEQWSLLRKHGFSLRKIMDNEDPLSHSILKKRYQRKKIRPSLTRMQEVLQTCHNNKTQAARQLGISRGSLSYQLRKSGQPSP